MSITALPRKTAAVALEGVSKAYGGGEATVRALDDVSVVFEPGTPHRRADIESASAATRAGRPAP